MNVEIGAEAAQFPEKEYINGIAVAVQLRRSGTRGMTCSVMEAASACRTGCSDTGY
jgi:hypothetical protein